jgi:hypothetical protein
MKPRKKLFSDESTPSSTSPWFSLSASESSSEKGITSTGTSIHDYVYSTISSEQGMGVNIFSQNSTVYEEENTCAELAEFLELLSYQQGNVCPPPSPVKLKQLLFARQESMKALEEALCSKLISQGAIDIIYENKALERLDRHCGRNYGRLMNAARSFNNRITAYDVERFNAFLQLNKVPIGALSEDHFKMLREQFTCMQLVVFLRLAKEYPLISRENI